MTPGAGCPPSVGLRRGIPIPRVAVLLGAISVLLLAAGLAGQMIGVRGWAGGLFSMDDGGSLPRLYVTGLLGSASVVAVLGARWQPARRPWWAAVAVVLGMLTATKVIGDIDDRLLAWSGRGPEAWPAAAAVLGGAAVAVIAALWWLSGNDRRDRRRVLGALGAHALAAVGLSAVSAQLYGGAGAGYALSTFVEEAAESLSAVALLVVVLVGVVPRLVLPDGSVPRRRGDDLSVAARRLAAGRASETLSDDAAPAGVQAAVGPRIFS